MAKASYDPMFETVSGALNKINKKSPHASDQKMVLTTHRVAPTTNPNCNRLFLRKKIKRSTPLTQDEIGARTRFKTVSQMIKARKADLSQITADQEAFMAQKNLPNGLKTMTKWYWSICGTEYDQDHN